MLRDAIELIQKTAEQAAAPRVVNVPGDERRVWLVHGEHRDLIDLPPAVRSHRVYSLDDVVQASARWGSEQGVLWHSDSSVKLLVDDDDRRDSVWMDLEFSEEFRTIRNLASMNGRHDQELMIRLLRYDLVAAVDPNVLAKIRKLKSSASYGTTSESHSGRERGTREYLAELAGAEELPETLVANVPVYTTLGLRERQPIKMALDCKVPDLTFDFRPLPDEVEFAVQAAQARLHETLQNSVEQNVEVFYGTPI